jgi:integrase
MGVFSKNGNFWIDYYANGRRRREKVGPSRSLAVKALRKRQVEVAEGKFLDVEHRKIIRFKDFTQIYIDSHARKKRSWLTTDVHYLKQLTPFFGNRFLHEIDSLLVKRYQTMRRGEKTYKGTLVSTAYVNRELACLKCMFSWAIRWGYVKENPVKALKMERENNERVRFLEKDELEKLIDCSDGAFRPALILAVNTGMRYGEMQYLRWKDVDFKRAIITLRDTKNGEKRQVPMNNTVLETLSSLSHDDGEAYVFCKKDGKPYNLRSPFLRAREKAGIKDFKFHDLRHTAASYLVMKGVDLNTVRDILGHRTLEMTLRYSHLSPEHKARAVSVLDEDMGTIWSPAMMSVQVRDKSESCNALIRR